MQLSTLVFLDKADVDQELKICHFALPFNCGQAGGPGKSGVVLETIEQQKCWNCFFKFNLLDQLFLIDFEQILFLFLFFPSTFLMAATLHWTKPALCNYLQ